MNETASQKIARWSNDPVAFVRENFQVDPDVWQVEALHAYNKNIRLAMKACKGPGKTTVLSWIAWHFLMVNPHPKIAATSITGDNLSDGLWTEMAKWQNKSPLLKAMFQWTKTRIFAKQHPETWWMAARSWPKGGDSNQQADTLAGLHADFMLFIIDESGGVPDAVMAAAEAALATGIKVKLVIAGNPTHLEGPLYAACTKERDLWYVIEITSDPDDPKRTPRVSVQWAREQIQKYGKDNPWVLVNVFGKFPPSSINTLLGPDEVAAAMKRHLKIDAYEFSQKRLGVDVARFGDDRTIIFPRQGLVAFKPVEMRGARSNEVAARVMAAKASWLSHVELIDGTGGYGAGVIDFMVAAGGSPIDVQFGGAPIKPKYLNKRAEMWFEMAEWIKRGGALPNDTELAKELVAPTYTFNAAGRLVLESKEQIKERLGFSPDKADALACTFAIPEVAADLEAVFSAHAPSLAGRRMVTEYDPFADPEDRR